MPRRFPPPWTAEQIPGGYVVKDAAGQALAYVYARETKQQAETASYRRWTKLAGSYYEKGIGRSLRRGTSALRHRSSFGFFRSLQELVGEHPSQ